MTYAKLKFSSSETQPFSDLDMQTLNVSSLAGPPPYSEGSLSMETGLNSVSLTHRVELYRTVLPDQRKDSKRQRTLWLIENNKKPRYLSQEGTSTYPRCQNDTHSLHHKVIFPGTQPVKT